MNEASIKGQSQAAGRRSHGGQDCTDRVSQQQHFQEPLTTSVVPGSVPHLLDGSGEAKQLRTKFFFPSFSYCDSVISHESWDC